MNHIDMTIQQFLALCDDATLDYIEESLLPQLIRIDRLNKLQNKCAELRQQIAEGYLKLSELNK